MLSLYTAVGRFERRANKTEYYPVIIINRKEHTVDLPEMIIWTCCSWRILDLSQLEILFDKRSSETGIESADFKGCVTRLLQRGLIVEGKGDNGDEALYDLLNSLYIIPVTSGILVKMAAFLKFIFINKIPFSQAKEIFSKESLSDSEKRVVGLAKQTQLSTAELIKCVECGVYDLSNDDKVMTALYNDDFTTCDNIGS
jgi:hypothetical protein